MESKQTKLTTYYLMMSSPSLIYPILVQEIVTDMDSIVQIIQDFESLISGQKVYTHVFALINLPPAYLKAQEGYNVFEYIDNSPKELIYD